ncbi:putative AP endonuclease 1, Endonuclease/exonuclease/phosphatase superfamily [Helianthus annuus]|nr:putative AP endonuclease 1, Endonuclease/exonuclease/phosphatase superfamily [Helianthus annuus]
MNLATTNIRGAGRSSEAKASMIRRLRKENNVAFYAIQETQLSSISDSQISRLWDNSPMDYAIADAAGRSGGLISLWNPTIFNVNLRIIKQNFIIVGGKVTGLEGDLFIVNVYAPNDDGKRKHLWHELVDARESFEGIFVFLGDFNEVLVQEDRLNSVFNPNNALAFNNFIRMAGLLEYNTGGAKFTYITPDGSKQSKLDRILVCDGFMDKWPNAKLTALPREKLDHRPLILQVNSDDFGPSPVL